MVRRLEGREELYPGWEKCGGNWGRQDEYGKTYTDIIGVARVRFEISTEESKRWGRGCKDRKKRSGRNTEEAGEDGGVK